MSRMTGAEIAAATTCTESLITFYRGYHISTVRIDHRLLLAVVSVLKRIGLNAAGAEDVESVFR